MTLIKKYDLGILRYMNLFEQITKFRPKDCFVTEEVVFYLTDRAKIAIGRQGINIKEMRKVLDREIKIVQWAESVEELAKSFLFPSQPSEIYVSDEEGKKILNIKFDSSRPRRMLLDNRQAELHKLKALVMHYFGDISDIKVLQNM